MTLALNSALICVAEHGSRDLLQERDESGDKVSAHVLRRHHVVTRRCHQCQVSLGGASSSSVSREQSEKR